MGDVSFVGPVHVKGSVVNNGQSLELSVRVEARLSSHCSRCLETVQESHAFDFKERYSHSSKEGFFAADANEDVIELQDDYLDIDEAVKDGILLNLPMKFLCSPDCPGICPHCGKNLKNGRCDCQTVNVDPRLAILSKLKEKS